MSILSCSFPAALAGPLAARLPGRLPLRPTAANIAFSTAATWEEYVMGSYQTRTLRQELTLRGQLQPDGNHLQLVATPPVPDQAGTPEPLEALAQRLAVLYEHLDLAVAPSGRLLGVCNQPQLQQRWQGLRTELAAARRPTDELTAYLLDFCDRQVADPVRLLRSLAFDYRYAALVGDFYDQPLGGSAAGTRPPRAFPQFFSGCGLWFTETLDATPTAEGRTLTLTTRGTLDGERTNVAAIERQVAARLPAGAELPPLRGHYAATHELEAATGLPRRVALTVWARLGEVYNKQYTLLIERL